MLKCQTGPRVTGVPSSGSIEQGSGIIAYSSTRRWGYYIQISKEAVLFCTVKKAGKLS